MIKDINNVWVYFTLVTKLLCDGLNHENCNRNLFYYIK